MGFFDSLKTLFGRSAAATPVGSGRGWHHIAEPFPGAWQRDIECTTEDLLSYHTVFAVISLIATDIAKLPISLKKQDENGIWQDYRNGAYSPVLRKPNRFQSRINFFENWVTSLLIYGNAYILKKRDGRGVVTEMFVLDASRVQVKITADGQVVYELSPDQTLALNETVLVPNSEIIHHRENCLYHPLVGISPLYAAALPVRQGREISQSQADFFSNSSRPGGILTAPGALDEQSLLQIQKQWQQSYGGRNAGAVAVLADGLTFKAHEPTSAANSQLFEQLGFTSEAVCSVFRVPPYKVGVGEMPTWNNVEALNQDYYANAIQHRLESIELALDEGLKMPIGIGTEFDVSALLRMDTLTLIRANREAVAGGLKTPNEGRRAIDLPPIDGGDTVYLQQQYFSLDALNRRDQSADPFGTGNGTKTQLKLWELENKLEEFKNAA